MGVTFSDISTTTMVAWRHDSTRLQELQKYLTQLLKAPERTAGRRRRRCRI